ncbi:Vitamin K-dependent gamma-carboxylase [Lamellibrachia satsuma]|nr:Vitamin K-dependent gamma-carboxylase [Lamellibrachia satsuma]
MYVVYLLMLTGASGIMLGLFYRAACLVFAVCYWYIFLLDKTRWNNHSYLYGLCSAMFLIFDGNRYFSLDCLRRPKIRNADVPLWNYCLFFLVYFIAGLKKLDADWVGGHSVQSLASHWTFKPFSLCLTQDQIDLWIVHRGGLFIDLFVGYFLFFDLTRPVGFLIAIMFHSMNSQIFAISMFPYTMLCTTPLFCRADWPKRLFDRLPSCLNPLRPSSDLPQYSTHCIYPKGVVKPEEIVASDAKTKRQSRVMASSQRTLYHNSAAAFSIIYLLVQCFLPYSHFLTPGYNNWTSGMYGYSWDMMVHSWSIQHVRISYVNKDTGDEGYLKPQVFTKVDDRWSYRADTVKQYAMCIKERMAAENMTNVALFFDVWRSVNNRFQQRMFDSRVDLVTAEWSPFQHTPWLMPLLTNLSDWRARMDEMGKNIYNSSSDIDVVFVADFPGLTLENYVQEEVGNASVEVLVGVVKVELAGQAINYTLSPGERLMLPPGKYHKVHTVSAAPSCYMYQYVNTTHTQLASKISHYEMKLKDNPDTMETLLAQENPQFVHIYENVQKRKEELERRANLTVWQRMVASFFSKYQNVIHW